MTSKKKMLKSNRKRKEEGPKLNLGEVDLGYTSHDKSEKKRKTSRRCRSSKEEKVETKPEEKGS